MRPSFISIPQALDELRQGKMLILVDDEDRENEGDLIIAAEKVTAEDINFMSKYARCLVCLPMAASEIDRLELPMMVKDKQNQSRFETAFTYSIEAASGVTTGISAADRAHTVRVACDPNSKPSDVVMPGHVFPLRAREGGVLVRSGHTEGSVDLMQLAGLRPAAVICEIMNDDGTMARIPELQQFSDKHQINMVSINDLIAYRSEHDSLVQELATSRLPIQGLGEFTVKIFVDTIDNTQHMALIRGDIDANKPCLVRVHSECLTGDVFGSARCDCGEQLHAALEQIAKEGGVLLYMSQEGRGIGLSNKIKAYAIQDHGFDTVEANEHLGFAADHRNYGIGTQILRYLGIEKMRLLTNNPRKIHGIGGYGIEIVSREPIEIDPNADNASYLQTKRHKLGHLLSKATASEDAS